MVKGASPPI
jgi:hypothetical protein